jgi:hypothetical protein
VHTHLRLGCAYHARLSDHAGQSVYCTKPRLMVLIKRVSSALFGPAPCWRRRVPNFCRDPYSLPCLEANAARLIDLVGR